MSQEIFPKRWEKLYDLSFKIYLFFLLLPVTHPSFYRISFP
jgi:hypothetical protein